MKWRRPAAVEPPANRVKQPAHAVVPAASAQPQGSNTGGEAKSRWSKSLAAIKAIMATGRPKEEKEEKDDTAQDTRPAADTAGGPVARLSSDASSSSGLVWQRKECGTFGFGAAAAARSALCEAVRGHQALPGDGRARSASAANAQAVATFEQARHTQKQRDRTEGTSPQPSPHGGGSPFAATQPARADDPTSAAVRAAGTAAVDRRGLMATKPIGRQGHVYLARQSKGQGQGSQHRVVKVLRPGASKQSTLAFEREVEMLASLRHPNILALVGTATTAYPMLAVFGLCMFGDLETFLNRCQAHGLRLRPREQLVVATQVASAMAHLEQQRIVHMNLAAKNILVDKRCMVKLADFGHARKLADGADTLTLRERAVLNPRWMAPESLGSVRVFSCATDVWSFGVVAWEIFTSGATPYSGVGAGELGPALSRKGTPLRLGCPSGCPPDWYQLLMLACWRANPAQRPSFSTLAQNAVMAAAVHASSSSTQEPLRNLGGLLEAKVQARLQLQSSKTQLSVELNELLVECMGGSASASASPRQPRRSRPRADTATSSTSTQSAVSAASQSSQWSGASVVSAVNYEEVATTSYEGDGGTAEALEEEDVYGTMQSFVATPRDSTSGPAHLVDNDLCNELEESIYMDRPALALVLARARTPRTATTTPSAAGAGAIVPEPTYIMHKPGLAAPARISVGTGESSTDDGGGVRTLRRHERKGTTCSSLDHTHALQLGQMAGPVSG